MKKTFRKKKTYPRKYRRYNYRKYGRSSQMAQRNPGRASVMKLPRGTLVADRLFTRLVYSQRIDLTPVGSAVDSYVFSGNSIFDPDVTGAGAQPLGYDQYSALYNKYKVRASKIVVQMVATSGSHFPCKVVLYPQDDSSSAAGVDNASARPNAISKITSGYGGQPTVLTGYQTTKAQFGLKSINEETSYAAVVGGNPNIRWYWAISVATLDATTNIADLYAIVNIEYLVEFYDVVDLNLS